MCILNGKLLNMYVTDPTTLLPDELIIRKIYNFREQKVMLDSDLALLYGVETKVLNQAVKRNMNRFPPDFMFQLEEEEFEILKSQFVTSSLSIQYLISET